MFNYMIINVPIQRAKRALTFKHECYEKSFSVIP